MEYIHLVHGGLAADKLQQALSLAKRNDEIINLRDDLSFGPIKSMDNSYSARAVFWHRIIGGNTNDIATELEATTDILKDLMQKEIAVAIWHGQSASDQLMLRRLIYHLRDMPGRLNEVNLTPNELADPLCIKENATPMGLYSTEVLAKRLPTIAPISILRIGRLALEWQELKRAEHEIRLWNDNTFKSSTFDELDSLILENTSHEWQLCVDVVSQAASFNPYLFSRDSIICWRCRELAEAGDLLLQGDAYNARTASIKLASKAPNAEQIKTSNV